MPDTQILGTRELAEQFSADPVNFHRSVAEEMRAAGNDAAPTLSAALEFVSPTEERGGLDAFERLLAHYNIRTQSDPAAGYWASNAARFLADKGTRALLVELARRVYRRVAFAHATRSGFLSGDSVAGSWERPYYDSQLVRWSQEIAPAIPLSELIAGTGRRWLVSAGVSSPGWSSASYEQMRRMQVDKLARMIAQMAVQSETDKVAAALDVIINGDGNSNAATTHDLTTLDSAASPGTLTLKGWLSFKMKFSNPYAITTALMQEAVALQLALLNTGSANVPLVGANLGSLGTALQPINQFADGVRYGWTADAPALKIVGIDRRFGLDHIMEVGSEITETERFVTRQAEVIVMSEYSGFAVADANAHLILDVNA